MYGFTYRVGCPACGLLADAGALEGHACADVRHAVAEFETAFAAWLETPGGLFAAWDAAHAR